jgi:hypothetical protein
MLAVLVGSAMPAQAELLGTLLESYGTCYARHYDEAHLAGHPGQRVTAISLSHTAEPHPDHELVLDFGFVLRNGNHYTANVHCRNARCSVEGDGGNFTVSETGDGLRIDVGDFLALEGWTDWSGDLAESDDKAFLIFPAPPRACRFE